MFWSRRKPSHLRWWVARDQDSQLAAVILQAARTVAKVHVLPETRLPDRKSAPYEVAWVRRVDHVQGAYVPSSQDGPRIEVTQDISEPGATLIHEWWHFFEEEWVRRVSSPRTTADDLDPSHRMFQKLQRNLPTVKRLRRTHLLALRAYNLTYGEWTWMDDEQSARMPAPQQHHYDYVKYLKYLSRSYEWSARSYTQLACVRSGVRTPDSDIRVTWDRVPVSLTLTEAESKLWNNALKALNQSVKLHG